jgi:hypothetical protein
MAQPWDLVEQLEDNLPFLLFPVRLETRFMAVENAHELWIRIFPDDIAVHTHEKDLTAREVDSGRTFWREMWAGAREFDEKKQAMEKGAWRVLAEAYGGTRAAWVARETEPDTLNVARPGDLQFASIDSDTMKHDSWSRAPRSNIMPDRFVVMGYSGEAEIYRQLGNLIPNPLPMGPEPQDIEGGYRQQDGDLAVTDDIAWMHDFERAVEIGMGVRIRLQEAHATHGLDRLLVLGLRLSSDEVENQALIEELFENHHYSPDGLCLLPQGAATNNADSGGSGYSSQDLGAEASYALQVGGDLFETTGNSLEKRDGQWLAEALGIDDGILRHVHRADQGDIQEALAINRALWNGTLGYYLEEFLGLDLATIERVRDFFTTYISGRGPVPSIRVGTQPYGILLTSDFSRWQWSPQLDGTDLGFLNRLLEIGTSMTAAWSELVGKVPHVGAPGDSYANLLRILGLHATSMEYHRRHAVGAEYAWNYDAFNIGTFRGRQYLESQREEARVLPLGLRSAGRRYPSRGDGETVGDEVAGTQVQSIQS